MMTFGWNNYPSMFQGPTAKDQTLQAVGAMMQAGVDIPSAVEDIAKAQASGDALTVSPTPACTSGGSWFYILLGLAVAGGLSHRRKR